MSDPVNTIRENLSESWTKWDVSEGDLLENNQVISDLDPAERNQVISELTDEDLSKWAGEINGLLGSLSESDRQALFNDLANGLDGLMA